MPNDSTLSKDKMKQILSEDPTANTNIRCTVDACKNHCNNVDYCSLDTISVETHEADPKTCECVDCGSFVAKSEY